MILISFLSFVLCIWFPSYYFQLTAVSIEDLKSEYVTPILKVLGSELEKLTFLYGSELVIQDLALCPKLEKLQILPWSFFQLLDSGEIDPLNPATFLSQLRVFQSNFCLGKWSDLFENKSSLVSLSLHCCHIGCLKDGFGSSDRPRKRFKSASEVRNAQENIWLPYQVIQSDNELNLSDSVRAQLSVRQPPINLQFFPESNDEDECAYVKEYYEKQKKQWIYFNTC